jgi:hypothetical protein
MTDSESSEEGDLACFFRRNLEEEQEKEQAEVETQRERKINNNTSKNQDTVDNIDNNVKEEEEVFQTKAQYSFHGLDEPITIVEEAQKGIGFQIWPAANFLCKWLHSQESGLAAKSPIHTHLFFFPRL